LSRPTNGWREGRDPVQRWLRIVTTIVVLGVFVYLSIGPHASDGSADRIVIIAMALGAVLLLLGYEGVVKLPMIGKDTRKDDDAR
jgi:hypothetical protein